MFASAAIRYPTNHGAPNAKVCHDRKNPTDRANAGAERRGDLSRASRFASAESAGAIAPAQAPTGTDRKTKTRAGGTEPAAGGIGAWPHGHDRQTDAFAGGVGAGSIRHAKETRAIARDAG